MGWRFGGVLVAFWLFGGFLEAFWCLFGVSTVDVQPPLFANICVVIFVFSDVWWFSGKNDP